MIALLAQVAVLAVGSILLSILYENIVGSDSFSLPLVNILLVVAIGGGLSYWHGWTSTTAVLGLYGVFCVVAGFVDR